MSVVSPNRTKSALIALSQGLLTLCLTLFGLLLITFALSALSPVDRVLQIAAITPASQRTIKCATSSGSINL